MLKPNSYTLTCRQAIFKKRQVLVKMWRTRNASMLLVRMQDGAAAMENNLEVTQKNKK